MAGAAVPEAEATRRAIAWLHTQQLPDGGFGEQPASETARSSASATADAVYTLARLGEDPGGKEWTVGGHSALDTLAQIGPAFARQDAGQAGKVARAVAAAGDNPRSFAGMDLIAIIEGFYNPATGRYNPDLQYRHSLALEAVARSKEPVPPAALDALLESRQPGGGWFWSFNGTASDVDSTGRIMETLAEYGDMHCAPAFLPTVNYLLAQQTAEGWGVGNVPGPANANSTALAAGGLRTAGYAIDSLRYQGNGPGVLDSLLAFQETSGAFVYTHETGHEESRLVATLDVLDALAEPPVQAPGCRTLYLPLPLAENTR